jgi:hypothetical protein
LLVRLAMTELARRGAILAGVSALALMASGCVGEPVGLSALAVLIALTAAGCTNRPRRSALDPIDAGGYCTPCCGSAPDPAHGCCWCATGTTCNYGFGCFGDHPEPDAGERFEACCVVDDGGTIGTVSTCFCPAATGCGFSFVDCGDATCAVGDGGACPIDGGEVDAGL